MARLGMVPRIIGLFLLLIVLSFGAIFWFDFLGLIDASFITNPITSLFGFTQETVNPDSPVLLDEIRVKKMEESLDLRYQELVNKTDALGTRELEVTQRVAEIDEREKALADRENSFNQTQQAYDTKEKNLVQNSQWLTSMAPDKAVEILKSYSDQDLIDVLRKTEELAKAAGKTSLVSVWLARLPAAKSAEIQRKMTIKPTE